MKILVAALFGVLLTAAPAAAQTIPSNSACADFTPAPATLDGAGASRDAMTAAGRRIETWRTVREQEQAACQAEISALRTQLAAMIEAYNSAGQERTATISAWNSEVAQFAARGGRRPAQPATN